MEAEQFVRPLDRSTDGIADVLLIRDVPFTRSALYIVARSIRRPASRSDALRDDGYCHHNRHFDDGRDHVAKRHRSQGITCCLKSARLDERRDPTIDRPRRIPCRSHFRHRRTDCRLYNDLLPV